MRNSPYRVSKCADRGAALRDLLVAVVMLSVLGVAAAPTLLRGGIAADVAATHDILRDVSTALESYRVDNGAFPACMPDARAIRGSMIPPSEPPILERLTTPISYITDPAPALPFQPMFRLSAATAGGLTSPDATTAPVNTSDPAWLSALYQSYDHNHRVSASVVPQTRVAIGFNLQATGPAQTFYGTGGVQLNSSGDGSTDSLYEDCLGLIYDPTNGTESFGAIVVAGGELGIYYSRQYIRAIRTSEFARSPVGATEPATMPNIMMLR